MEPTIEEQLIEDFKDFAKVYHLDERNVISFLRSNKRLKKYGDARYQEGRNDAVSYIFKHSPIDECPPREILDAARKSKEV